jgi:hypothetical protein
MTKRSGSDRVTIEMNRVGAGLLAKALRAALQREHQIPGPKVTELLTKLDDAARIDG